LQPFICTHAIPIHSPRPHSSNRLNLNLILILRQIPTDAVVMPSPMPMPMPMPSNADAYANDAATDVTSRTSHDLVSADTDGHVIR
jgi:hypothetical protein